MILPLQSLDGHLFLEIADARWLVDTGAPASFGMGGTVDLAGREFGLAHGYLGMTPETLSGFVSVECAGLLGADILGELDFILDVPGGTAELSSDQLRHDGVSVPLEAFMGIPILSARIAGADHRMFFDTGAQISYFQGDALKAFPPAGTFEDFYPGFGQFETETYTVEAEVGGVRFALRCGSLPGLLGATLMMAGTQGIVGTRSSGSGGLGTSRGGGSWCCEGPRLTSLAMLVVGLGRRVAGRGVPRLRPGWSIASLDIPRRSEWSSRGA